MKSPRPEGTPAAASDASLPRESTAQSGTRRKAPPHVMLVAPVSLRRSILARALVQKGYDVSPASDLPQFANILGSVAAVDVVIVDPAACDLRRLVEIAPHESVHSWILWSSTDEELAELPPPSVSFRHDAMSRLLLDAVEGLLARRTEDER